MSPETPGMTVYYDGSCPLCRAEIDHYRKQDSDSKLIFHDVSCVDRPLEADLSRTQAMRRFHVRRPDGDLVSGASAFVSLWTQLPRWRWVARIATVPGVLPILEVAYRIFLPIRPIISWSFRARRSARAG